MCVCVGVNVPHHSVNAHLFMDHSQQRFEKHCLGQTESTISLFGSALTVRLQTFPHVGPPSGTASSLHARDLHRPNLTHSFLGTLSCFLSEAGLEVKMLTWKVTPKSTSKEVEK